jgi:hypothetical protein
MPEFLLRSDLLMTDRERWTVYPLLFLALGIAVKDKLPGPVRIDDLHSKAVFCRELIVTDQQGKEQVFIAANDNGGYIRTTGNKNDLRTVVGNSELAAGLMFVDPQGRIHPGSVFALPHKAQPKEGDEGEPASP